MTVDEKIPGLRGIWNICAYEGDIRKDAEGKILNKKVWEETKENIIVTSGKDLALDRLFGLASAVALADIGVGTDSTTASAGQTKLNPSVAGSVQINAVDSTPTRSAETVTAISTFPASGAAAAANFIWAECGLFNGTVNGTSVMFNRLIIGPFTKTSAVSIVVTIQITQS